MAQLIRPNNVKIVTQDGEVKVTIALELSINLNSDGLKISGSTTAERTNNELDTKVKADNTVWEIPDFTPMPKVAFGKGKGDEK